jgi:hypothetical protein
MIDKAESYKAPPEEVKKEFQIRQSGHATEFDNYFLLVILFRRLIANNLSPLRGGIKDDFAITAGTILAKPS